MCGKLAREQMNLAHVARAFLDGREVLRLADAGRKVFTHHDADAGGIVVEHDRQVGRAVDRQRMNRILALGRQRVGRGGDQDRVGADLLRCFGVSTESSVRVAPVPTMSGGRGP